MNRSFSFAFAAFCAAGLSFAASAETWTWIGGSTWGWGTPASGGSKKVIDLGSVEKADRLRDWTDGYNWQDSQGVRGDHPGEGTHTPQHGDVIVFDTDGKNEYTHCYGGGSGIDYGGILFKGSKAWSGYFGSQPVVKDGFVSNTIPQNVNLAYVMGAGTVELYCCSGGSLQFQLLKKSGASAASYVKTGPGTFRWQENGTSAYSTFDLSEGTVLLRNAGLLDGGTTKFLMSGPQTELDLNGFSQNLKCALEQTSAETKITSSSGTLVLLLSGNKDDTEIKGKISGSVSICWNPNDSTKTLTLSGGVCDTAGTLIASNGVIEVAAGSTFAHAKFDVEGGLLKFGAKTALASGCVMVNDTVVEDGFYTGSGPLGQQVDWLVGDQLVVIGVGGETGETVEATWNGTGNLSTVANWQGAAELPPLGNGMVKMSVAGGNSATVDANYWIRGIAIGSGVSTFGFDGDSLLWLGSLGLKTPGVGGTYTISAPLGLTTVQTWTVGAGDTLNVATAIQTVAPGTVTLDGPGTVNANVAQPDLANDIYVNGGKVVVNADGGLGTGETVINQANASIDFAASRYAGPVTYTASTGLSLHNDRDYVFGGRFTYHGKGFEFVPQASKTWVFSGFYLDNDKQALISSGTVVFTNDILKLSDRSYLSNGATAIFAAPNNRPGGNEFIISGNGSTLKTTIDYAFNVDKFGIRIAFCSYAAGGSVWDLCGTEQSVLTFQGGYGAIGTFANRKPGSVISEKPGMLHVYDDAYRRNPSGGNYPSPTNWTVFVGMAGFSKDGTYPGHWLMSESSSIGTVQVTNGKLYLANWSLNHEKETFNSGSTTKTVNEIGSGTGSWPNAAKAIAKGSGTLVFEHSKAIGKKTDVIIEGGGKVQLDAGVNQRCADLYFGDEKQELGTWGSPESVATHKDARFTGTGVLTVRGRHPGLLLLFR